MNPVKIHPKGKAASLASLLEVLTPVLKTYPHAEVSFMETGAEGGGEASIYEFEIVYFMRIGEHEQTLTEEQWRELGNVTATVAELFEKANITFGVRVVLQ